LSTLPLFSYQGAIDHTKGGFKMAEKKLLEVDQYAELYHMHPTTVARLCREGKLPSQKVGSRWRIAVDAELVDNPEGETQAQAERRALLDMLDSIGEVIQQTRAKLAANN
jgi:hypothetical protein